MGQPARHDLAARSLLAVLWGAGGGVARLLLQFGAQVVLARILGPEQYGIFAIGAIVISFSNFFSDVGLAYGLIQKKEVSEHDVRFVFTWQVVLGTLVTVAVFLAAESIAAFFGDPRAAGVVQVLAVVCLLNALVAPSLNLLKRDLDFKRIQIAQVSGFIIGYVAVGIPLALYGAQVWALVMAWLVQAGVVLLLAYRASRHALTPLLRHHEARALTTYGGTVFITNIVNWAIGNIDRVIVGRMFDSREIGLYATTYNMLQTPTSSLLGIVQPVFFAASSRVTEDGNKIAAAYRALIAAVATYILPVFVAVAAVSETFILALYGTQWHAAAEIFTPLALAMPLFMVWGFTTPLLWTGGHASKEFKTQLPMAVIWAAATWLAAQHSLVAVAWTVFALYLLRCLVMLQTAVHYLQLSRLQLWRAMRGGVTCTLVVVLAVKLCDLGLMSLPALVRLSADAAMGAFSLYMVLRWLPGLMSSELMLLNRRVIARLPAPVAKQLDFLC